MTVANTNKYYVTRRSEISPARNSRVLLIGNSLCKELARSSTGCSYALQLIRCNLIRRCKSRQRTSNTCHRCIIYCLSTRRGRIRSSESSLRSARCHDCVRAWVELRFRKIAIYSPRPPTLTRSTRCINARARGAAECAYAYPLWPSGDR